MIDHQELRNTLSYNPETGIFRNARGKEVGSYTPNSVVITVKGKTYTGLRLAWFYTHGEWPVGNARAKNGNAMDCRLNNISVKAERPAPRASAGWASDSPHITTNGVKHVRGVTQDTQTGKWVARPTIKRKRTFLGKFATRDEAEAAVLAAFA